MQVVFDTLNIYYLPQYLPVFRELQRAGHESKFVCYLNKNKKHLFAEVFERLGAECYWVEDARQATDLYVELKPDWVVFGTYFNHLAEVHLHSKTAHINHGIGSKSCYYHDLSLIHI